MSQLLAVPEHFIPARIERIELATPLIKVFTLVTDSARFHARPGQWLDLAIPRAGEPFIGGYSVVSAPSTDGRLQLAIKYADHHHATHHLHTVSREGDEVLITAGQGPFYFDPGMAPEVVLLGAGIGVTPLMSILRFIHAEASEVEAHLVYSVASRHEVLFADELVRMAHAPNIHVTLTVTRDAEDWLGHTGRISHPLLESLKLPRKALYYYCGSRDFIEDMTELLTEWGIPEEQLRYEKWW
jgi:ferredoxin-NADP reductase